MESDLRKIFEEILIKVRSDLSNIEIRSSAGYKFAFIHNRLAGYEFPDTFKALCNQVIDNLNCVAQFPNKDINKTTFFQHYVAELITTNLAPENLQFFDQIMAESIELEIKKIVSWLSLPQRKFTISILLNTDFKVNAPIDGWIYTAWDRRESALTGYRSGVSDMMFFHNYVDAFWLVKEFDDLPPWSDLVELLSVLRMSLSLSVKERIIIHDVHIKFKNWDRCPFVPIYFMKRSGHIEELRTDSDASRFFLHNFARKIDGPSFSHERIIDSNLYYKWKSIVSEEKYRTAFHHIFNGLSDILKSQNYGNFNESFITSDGLTKVFIGLDGMLPDQASRLANMSAFVSFWHPIFSHVVTNLSKKKTKKIYALRCALIHGDYDDFRFKCPEVFKIICPNSTDSSVTIQHFAFNFASFLTKVIAVIENNPQTILETAVLKQQKSWLKKMFDYCHSFLKPWH
jgi:hypothetical protein